MIRGLAGGLYCLRARPMHHLAADELQQIAIEALLVRQIEGVCRILVDFELTADNGPRRPLAAQDGRVVINRSVNDQRGHGKGLHVRAEIVLPEGAIAFDIGSG